MSCSPSRKVVPSLLPAGCVAVLLFLTGSSASAATAEPPGESGLLFHLSGKNGVTADFARGDAKPSVTQNIEIISDGAVGPGFRCPHYTQILAYWAPGNIYAQRGTLAFFWRARDPIGRTPFPIFQVSYADHSTIDMAWLRIDYNGHGFDAFVTDASLARARVSYTASVLPKPDRWTHFALTWDETQGIRFSLDGKLVGKVDLTAVFDAGLDQFGAHGDVIGPQDVSTEEQFQRGGDIDELRIYDQMLSLENIALLAKGQSPVDLKPLTRDLGNPVYQAEWWLRYGWNRPEDNPPYLTGSSVKVRKVEIHDVYDLKQWFWKGNDGIRETTWPGVYNRSRLPGRTDYFIRPDWNCYSTSGKSVTFALPDEPWNHLEIAGSAYGAVSLQHLGKEAYLFDRPQGQERTFHRLARAVVGGKLRFDNQVQETPIGEFSAYYVSSGREPEGSTQLTYTLTHAKADNPTLDSLVSYINGRFVPDEQTTMIALPEGARRPPKASITEQALPLIHILIPFEFRVERPGEYEPRFSYTWENLDGGLDGIALDLPALKVKPTHGDHFPVNVQVKDPLWPLRNLLDFTFSVKPGEAKTLWLDTRDRILPNGYSLYLSVAGAGSDFSPALLEGAQIRLIFKGRKEATGEHEVDRFTQVKDNVGNFLEWGSNKKRLQLYERYSRDITDLLRVNPNHLRGRYYWSYLNPEQGWPAFEQPKAPADIPLWAFRQIEVLKLLKHFVNWWIDKRQIENGEFGGGLSDDGDLTSLWPGAALMGIDPEKITRSVQIEMDAFYRNGMFTNGLNTILTDNLHTYEEGIQVLAQTMLLEYGDPKVVERIMETAKALEHITGIDKQGHRHIRSSFFSGTEISEDPVWAAAHTDLSHLILHPALVLVEYNGHPRVKKLLLELADGLLAHRRRDVSGNYCLPGEIFFPSGEERGCGLGSAAHLFWAAWRWTGEEKYLLPVFDRVDQGDFSILRALNANLIDLLGKHETWGQAISALASSSETYTREARDLKFYRHVGWQTTGNKKFLENYYADQIQEASQRMSMFTEDHWWVDRVSFPSGELQRSRLGGVALLRGTTYPGHVISWKFEAPATGESVAILVPEATTTTVKIIAFNLESQPVTAIMTAWDLAPGIREVGTGIDTDGDDVADRQLSHRMVELERSRDLRLRFEPKATTIVELKLKSSASRLWDRPDLGIGLQDLHVVGNQVKVTIHSLGAVDAPTSDIVLRNTAGTTVARAQVPPLKAPLDLVPKTAEVTLEAPAGTLLSNYKVWLDPEDELDEITIRNNVVVIP
jgi:Concanavalin A-like lectin/glucanases superfamily